MLAREVQCPTTRELPGFQISDVFTSTPDTNYYAIRGMYNCHVGRDANRCALAHLKRYNLKWGIPIAPEAWSKTRRVVTRING
jgi:hypothetical protein